MIGLSVNFLQEIKMLLLPSQQPFKFPSPRPSQQTQKLNLLSSTYKILPVPTIPSVSQLNSWIDARVETSTTYAHSTNQHTIWNSIMLHPFPAKGQLAHLVPIPTGSQQPTLNKHSLHPTASMLEITLRSSTTQRLVSLKPVQ